MIVTVTKIVGITSIKLYTFTPSKIVIAKEIYSNFDFSINVIELHLLC